MPEVVLTVKLIEMLIKYKSNIIACSFPVYIVNWN